MAATNSTMLPLGTKAPAFTLPDPGGRQISLSDFPDALAVVVVYVQSLPVCEHLRNGLAQLARSIYPAVALRGSAQMMSRNASR
jgi:hypothetical protein